MNQKQATIGYSVTLEEYGHTLDVTIPGIRVRIPVPIGECEFGGLEPELPAPGCQHEPILYGFARGYNPAAAYPDEGAEIPLCIVAPLLLLIAEKENIDWLARQMEELLEG